MRSLRDRGIRPPPLAGCFLMVLVLAGCARHVTRASTGFDWGVFLADASPFSQGLLSAVYLTVVIAVLSQAIGVGLGVFSALGKMSRFWLFRLIANFYIWFFRGTPLVVQLGFFYYGVGAAQLWGWDPLTIFGVTIPGAIQAGIVILGVNEGAYMAEIIRAGIMAVDPGQTEAAKSLGMTYGQTMRRIVLPQAARVIIPPLGNEFNNMLKTTSLLSALSIFELYNTFSVSAGHSYATFELFAACAVWYLLLTTIWGFAQARIELRFAQIGRASCRERV